MPASMIRLAFWMPSPYQILFVGIVPAYSRDVFEDRFDDCTFMYKQLARKAQLSA